jgi:Flp pilus assembly pilin Flp
MSTDLKEGRCNSAGNTTEARGRLIGVRQIDKGGNRMNYFSKLLVMVRESKTGQTMTEYVLIVAAIAVAGYIAYQGLEGGINTIITNVTSTLKAA